MALCDRHREDFLQEGFRQPPDWTFDEQVEQHGYQNHVEHVRNEQVKLEKNLELDAGFKGGQRESHNNAQALTLSAQAHSGVFFKFSEQQLTTVE